MKEETLEKGKKLQSEIYNIQKEIEKLQDVKTSPYEYDLVIKYNGPSDLNKTIVLNSNYVVKESVKYIEKVLKTALVDKKLEFEKL